MAIPLNRAVLCEDCQMITQATQSVCLACGSRAIYSLQAMLEKGSRGKVITRLEQMALEATEAQGMWEELRNER